VILCVLCLGRDFGVIFLPNGQGLEERGGSEQSVDGVAAVQSVLKSSLVYSYVLGGLVFRHIFITLGKGL